MYFYCLFHIFWGIYSQHGASLLDRKEEVSFFFSLPIIRTPLQGGFLGAAQPVNMNHQPPGRSDCISLQVSWKHYEKQRQVTDFLQLGILMLSSPGSPGVKGELCQCDYMHICFYKY